MPDKEQKLKRPRGRPRKNPNTQKVSEVMTKKLNELTEVKESLSEQKTKFPVLNQFPKDDVGLTKWLAQLEEKITSLTVEIDDLDKKYKSVCKDIERVEEAKSNLQSERIKLKNGITEDQDRLYQWEQKMLQTDSLDYRPDLPDFLRPLIQFVTRKPDGILLRSQIAKSEGRISQRENRLVSTHQELSDVLIAAQVAFYHQDVIQSVSEKFRAARREFGKIQREVLENLNRKTNEETQNTIVRSYVETMKNIDSTSSELGDSITTAIKNTNGLVERSLELKASTPERLDNFVNRLENTATQTNSVDLEGEGQ